MSLCPVSRPINYEDLMAALSALSTMIVNTRKSKSKVLMIAPIGDAQMKITFVKKANAYGTLFYEAEILA